MALLFITSANAAESTAYAPGWRERSIITEGMERVYRVYVPVKRQRKAPAVIVLHGGTQNMYSLFGENAGASQEWQSVADDEGILLFVPNGVGKKGILRKKTGEAESANWNDYRTGIYRGNSNADDVGFLNMVVDNAIDVFNADPARIYITGASNGGMMALRMLSESAERFAAAAALNASLPQDVSHVQVPAMPTPLMLMNGTEDPLVKWNGGMIKGRRGKTMPVMDNVAWWVEANRADTARMKSTLLPDISPNDGCRIEKTTYPAMDVKVRNAIWFGAPSSAEVVFYKMDGGGHASASIRHKLPEGKLVQKLLGNGCEDAESARLAWDFFKDKTRAVKKYREY